MACTQSSHTVHAFPHTVVHFLAAHWTGRVSRLAAVNERSSGLLLEAELVEALRARLVTAIAALMVAMVVPMRVSEDIEAGD